MQATPHTYKHAYSYTPACTLSPTPVTPWTCKRSAHALPSKGTSITVNNKNFGIALGLGAAAMRCTDRSPPGLSSRTWAQKEVAIHKGSLGQPVLDWTLHIGGVRRGLVCTIYIIRTHPHPIYVLH